VTDVTVLDASVLIAAMSLRDAHHGAAVRLLRAGAVQGALIAHPLTIAESVVGAAAAGRTEQLRKAYVGLGIHNPPDDLDQPWRWAQFRADTRLPLPDCCVLDTALTLGAQLATFDDALGAAARRYGVPVMAD
jgi:predicted nucleic acid-binding protein